MAKKQITTAKADQLRRHAEGRLRERQRNRGATVVQPPVEPDVQRLLHEFQVHEIELEMQNTELKETSDRLEALLQNFTDLYDFAPVGYFSLNEQGVIMGVNLTGSIMLGVVRSQLVNQRLQRYMAPTSQPIFSAFLKKVFIGPGRQVCEVALNGKEGVLFWADLQAVSAVFLGDAKKWCRVAVSDISALKRADEAQRRADALVITNRALKQEIAQRHIVEKALKKSQLHQSLLLEQSRHMQEQFRHLSHQMLQVQEEERKRISRELHDQIAQTLVGINVHLEGLSQSAKVDPKRLRKEIAHTQLLVSKSVQIVQHFARELRPTLLDDLGVIPALHSYINEWMKRTKVRVQFTALTSAKIAELSTSRRTVLYRVAQSSLTNIAEHARASQVTVVLQKTEDAVCLEICDNGKSFDVERVFFADRRKRLGLLGMRERVEMVGGRFSIVSAPGKGTTVRAEIPFGQAHAHEKKPLITKAEDSDCIQMVDSDQMLSVSSFNSSEA
jgi:signal transduction histidine kinase